MKNNNHSLVEEDKFSKKINKWHERTAKREKMAQKAEAFFMKITDKTLHFLSILKRK